MALLTAAADGCGRPVPDREIRAAVMDAKATAWEPKGPSGIHQPKPAPKWPAVNATLRNSILAEPYTLNDLRDASPTTSDTFIETEWYIDELFPGNPLLCVAHDPTKFKTDHRDNMRGMLGKLAFIVPSPMSALTGKTKDGKESGHTLDNTGPRKYLVTEFDFGTFDEQAAIIAHLAKWAPLVMVLSSAGKSVHAWWKAAESESRMHKFMRYAVSLGADRATWPKCHLVRMPEGLRSPLKRQNVYYFNSPSNE